MPQSDFFDLIASKEVVAAIVTAILAGVGQLLQPRVKLQFGIGNQFTYSVPNTQQHNPNIFYIVSTVFLKNAGRTTAKNVELTFNYKPEHFQFWPPITYTEKQTPDNRHVLVIPFLSAKESLTLNLLMATPSTSGMRLPELLHVRSEHGPAKGQILTPTPIMSKKIALTLWLLIFVGVYQILLIAVLFIKKLFLSDCLLNF